MATTGVVLFAHGSRDSRWADPFLAIEQRVAQRLPDVVVTVAYLESMAPDLASATAALARRGVTRIQVVPLFLGQGGHVREDLPRRVAAAAAAHPEVKVRLSAAAGEQEGVREAIAAYCVAEALGGT